MSGWPKWIVGTALLLIAAFVSLVYGLYWQGARLLPAELPGSRREYPAQVRDIYWRSMGGRDEIAVERMDPLRFVWRFVSLFNEYRQWSESAKSLSVRPREPVDLALLNRAARLAYRQSLGERRDTRHQAEIALQIRYSHERTPAQIIDYALDRSWYGRGATGYDEAALAYFGVPPEQLTRAEHVALITLEWSPSALDPDGHRQERFRRRYMHIAGLIGMPTADIDFDRDLARLKPASKTP